MPWWGWLIIGLLSAALLILAGWVLWFLGQLGKSLWQ